MLRPTLSRAKVGLLLVQETGFWRRPTDCWQVCMEYVGVIMAYSYYTIKYKCIAKPRHLIRAKHLSVIITLLSTITTAVAPNRFTLTIKKEILDSLDREQMTIR